MLPERTPSSVDDTTSVKGDSSVAPQYPTTNPSFGPDRVGADVAGQALVVRLGSTTAAGLARRISTEQWGMVETGIATVTGRMLDQNASGPTSRSSTSN